MKTRFNISIMCRGRLKFFWFCLALMLPLIALAEISVNVEVPRKKLSPDEGLLYRVHVEASGEDLPDNVRVNFPKKLTKQGVQVSGPQVSSSYSFQMSGSKVRKSRSARYEYILSFDKAGQYEIKGVRVKVGKKEYRLTDVIVDVDSKYVQRQHRSGRGRSLDPFGIFQKLFPQEDDSGFRSLFDRQGMRPPQKTDVKLVVQPSTTLAVEGEPIWVKLIAYIHKDFDPQMLSPHFNLGKDSIFWKEDMTDSRLRALRQRDEADRDAYLVTEFVLFPLRPGVEVFKGVDLSLTLIGGIRSFPMQAKAEPVEINVVPLPDPKPTLPLVSDYMETELTFDPQEEAETDKPISFQFNVSGLANLRLIEDVPIENIPEMDVVLQEDRFDVLRQPSQFRLQKAGFFIFRKPGTYKLKLAGLTYYDPARKTYQKTDEKTWDIKVVQGTGSTQLAQLGKPTSSGAEKLEVTPEPFQLNMLWVVLGGIVLGLLLILTLSWRLKRRYLKTQVPKGPSTEGVVVEAAVSEPPSTEFKRLLEREPPVDTLEILDFLSQQGFLGESDIRTLGGPSIEIQKKPAYQLLINRYQTHRYAGVEVDFGPEDRKIAIQMAEELLQVNES